MDPIYGCLVKREPVKFIASDNSILSFNTEQAKLGKQIFQSNLDYPDIDSPKFFLGLIFFKSFFICFKSRIQ